MTDVAPPAGPFPVVHLETIGSTNDEAMALAARGARGPLFVTATSQTGGRGRRGRTWMSPPGNLYASLLLTDPAPRAALPQLGLVAGVALAQALRELLGDDQRIRLKWPNDIVVAGAKLAGLLLESTNLPDGRLACVIGFGVNCASHPSGLAYPATDLTEVAGRPVAPAEVLAALGPRVQTELERWNRGDSFSAVRTVWLAFAAGVGDMVSVKDHSRTLTGRFVGLDATGRLIVETGTELITIDAGDVFLHGARAP